jgi:hypothetical protein
MSGKGCARILSDIGDGCSCLLKPSREMACSILIATHRENGVALIRQAVAELFHQWSQGPGIKK